MKKLFAACVVSAVAFISAVNAQGFPKKMIRIIVPFTPGDSNDVVAREIAGGLQASLNQTAVVENKPVAGAPSPIPMWRSRRRTVMSC
jgi:tripartite-type tricarboxylate transporter receptor subunit TctC